MNRLALPYYYHETVDLFWKGELLELLPKDTDPSALIKLHKRVVKQLNDVQKNHMLRFLLGMTHWRQYCRHETEAMPEQDNLSKQIGKLKLGIDQLIELVDILNTLIDYGNIRGFWDFKLVLRVEKIPQIKNPIGIEKDWQQTLYCAQLNELLSQKGYQSVNEMDGVTKLGMVTLSLLFDSYVINQTQLIGILKKIGHLNHFHYHNDRLFFLEPADDFNPPRKVYLSKKTEVLIYRAGIEARLPANSSKQIIQSMLAKAIHRYLKHLNIAHSNLPKTLGRWCQLTYKYLHLSIPPVIVNYLTGISSSHALNRVATKRILDIDLSEFEDLKESICSSIKRAEVKRNTSYSLKLIQQTFDVKVKSRDASKIQAEILSNAQKHLPILSNNYALIMQWGLSMLDVGRNKTFKVGPAQILTRIYAIGRHLVGLANQKKIQLLTPSQRAELYEAVMDEAISSRNLETIQYHLRSFNTWLEKYFSLAPLLNKADFFGDPKLTDLTVNANVIHFDEFEQIKITISLLCQKEPLNRTFSMMRLALILGFRCALRSKEAFQLKLEDFIFCEQTPQIAIRESEGREIKTPNAKRFLKLTELMPEDEVQFLKDWYLMQSSLASQIQKNKDKRSDFYYFSSREQLDQPVLIERIKSPLMRLVRDVCQDDSLNFHHLRHSFASWHFLSACNAELDLNIEKEFSHLPVTSQWLMGAQERKLQHLPTHLKSKKYAFWLQKNMGHGGFETTFEHYVHFADLVVSGLLSQVERQFSIDEIAQFSGLSISTLKKQTDRMNYSVARSIKPYETLKLAKETSVVPAHIWQPTKIDITSFRPGFKESSLYKMMEVYHLSSESTLSANDNEFDFSGFDLGVIMRIQELFRLNPKYRIRRLRGSEEIELQNLIQYLEDAFSVCLETFELTPDLYSVINTFMNRFYPMNSDRESLSVQKQLNLVMSDQTSAAILLRFIQQLNLPFKITLRYSQKWSDKEVRQRIKQWRKELNLKSDIKFESKVDNKKKIGSRARIEIIVKNTKGTQNHAFYYLMIMLSAWSELNQKIS